MAGIYIHIPFCRSKCHYCNFYSVASSKQMKIFIPALLKEIELQKNYLEGEKISTIYFGGGTPSLLDYDMLSKIMDSLQQNFEISSDAEITIEANPNDLDQKKLNEFKQANINRISIGIQSFFEEDLKYLNRTHSSPQAEAAVKRSQDAGFENISLDLIYGIPTLPDDHWKKNLEHIFSFSVPHLSAYSLTVEPNTILERFISKGKQKPVNEEQGAHQFSMLMQIMEQAGFLHYEVSNFCKEGFISKHNSNYWKGQKYLGLGPSAHSYNQRERQWNCSNIEKYLEEISGKKIPFEKEILSETDKFNEYIMTSLRTMWGCDLNYIEKNFGIDRKNFIEEKSLIFLRSGKMKNENNILLLTDDGFLFADGIAAEMFEVET
jgi:oxygen-independent coproporphyrinogen III oxidase